MTTTPTNTLDSMGKKLVYQLLTETINHSIPAFHIEFRIDIGQISEREFSFFFYSQNSYILERFIVDGLRECYDILVQDWFFY